MFNIFSALSLVLSLIIVVDWPYSYRTVHQLSFVTAGNVFYGAAAADGKLDLCSMQKVLPILPFRYERITAIRFRSLSVVASDSVGMLGFSWYRGDFFSRPFHGLQVPLWFVMLLTAALPALWVRHRLKHGRKLGFCARCGYNLTGNVSGVCPECGTAIAADELLGPEMRPAP